MAKLEFVRVDLADRVATVTFDRPPVNALNHQAWRELTEAFTTLGRDHLDYHASEEAYLAAKLRLFSECVAPESVRSSSPSSMTRWCSIPSRGEAS